MYLLFHITFKKREKLHLMSSLNFVLGGGGGGGVGGEWGMDTVLKNTVTGVSCHATR